MIQFKASLTGSIAGDLSRVKQELAAYPQRALTQFREFTPVRSGNARRRTTLRQDVILAQYPYAQRLDQGWSRQAPDGMTKPMQQWQQKEIRRIERKL